MDPTIIAALIGSGTTIILALLGYLGRIKWVNIKSLDFRKRQGIPDIMGTAWKADWFTEKGELYVSDRIEFKKWGKNNQFSGFGDMTTDPDGQPKRYVYPIKGEVTASRMVFFTYRAEGFPTQSLIGSACMELGDSAHDLTGWWVGRRKVINSSGEKEWKLLPGKVVMKKIS